MFQVFLDSTPDGVNKSFGFAQALAKEGFESLPADRNICLVLFFTLMLLPAEQNGIFQEGSRKRNSFQAHGIGGGKVIFALLEEIITF